MIKIFNEDTMLDVSSVVIESEENDGTEIVKETPEEAIPNEKDETIENKDDNPVEPEDSKLQEKASSAVNELEEVTDKPSSKESSEVYEDYIGSLNEQIAFLKSQVDEKNRQLTSKDELILNFQYLIKEDRNRILLLENKIEEEREVKKDGFWKRIFNKSEA